MRRLPRTGPKWWKTSILFILCLALGTSVPAQDYSKYTKEALDREMTDSATADLAVLVPMRDGIGLSTNIYRPRNAAGPLPTILWKTPYNEHKLGGMAQPLALEAIKRGYVFIVQNERGRFFSEGKFELLGKPQTDGYDALSWIAKQPWSNGKVGTLGCSSSAEWQLALAAMNHPAHAAMVPMAVGAGIGKVGRFQQQGNWYTGGIPRNANATFINVVDNPFRAELPHGLDQATRAYVANYNDLDAKKPPIDWVKQVRHLPVDAILTDTGAPPSIFEKFIKRTPADPGWWEEGLYHDTMGWGVPALWFNSWYDTSVAPNMELFNHARQVNSDREASANQYAVIAPTLHCGFWNMGPNSKIGERDMGDTSFDTNGAIFAWFDRWLKGKTAAWPASTPHVQYYVMGANRWEKASSWPPKGIAMTRFYLRSAGNANSLNGDGRLERAAPPAGEAADSYRYDPMNPVQTVGGGQTIGGGLAALGALDQRGVEIRNDVLVYTSEPLAAPMTVTGFVDAVLKVSSNAKDTDFTVKLVDIAPDGTAWIVADTIFRARYRDGFDKPHMMEPGKIYTIRQTPMATSIQFGLGHRIRVDISSSNFPRYVRNLNTGGANESESTGIVALNNIHHSDADASYIDLPVAR